MQANVKSAFSLELSSLGCLNLNNYLLIADIQKIWHNTASCIFAARYNKPILTREKVRSNTSFIPKLKIKKGRL